MLNSKRFSWTAILAIACGTAVMVTRLILSAPPSPSLIERGDGFKQASLLVDIHQQYIGSLKPCLTDSGGHNLSSWRFALVAAQWHDEVQGNEPPLDLWRWRRDRDEADPSRLAKPRLDLPWNAPENATWARYMCRTFSFGDDFSTNICAVVGAGTGFASGKPFRDLPDQLVVLIEVCDFGGHWMACGDVDVTDIQEGSGIHFGTSGNRDRGIFVGRADGSIYRVSRSIDRDVLRRLCLVDEVDKVDPASY